MDSEWPLIGRTAEKDTLARVFSISESSSTAMIIGVNQARKNLIAEAADRQLLVWVDNANLLDDASVETLTQMAMSGEAQVVMTLRNDEPVPQPITMLWKKRIADRIEIEPLTESATRTPGRSRTRRTRRPHLLCSDTAIVGREPDVPSRAADCGERRRYPGQNRQSLDAARSAQPVESTERGGRVSTQTDL